MRLVFLAILLSCSTNVFAQPAAQPLDSAAVDRLTAEFGPRLERSHYLARGPASEAKAAGWEGFPIERHTYSVTDKDGTEKKADVIVLLPSPEQVARWIVEAVTEVKGQYDEPLARKAFGNIIGQSGGQFPVAGVVYEDILPADGVNEVYCFRDGVTVAVEGVKLRKTEPLTSAEIEASINGPIAKVYTYARIASTKPEWFIAVGGDPAVLGPDGKPTKQWPIEIRKAFQQAWGKDRNLLIVAWVKANATPPATTQK